MVWADTEAVGCGFLTTKGITFEDDKEKMTWMGAKDWDESVRAIFSTSKSTSTSDQSTSSFFDPLGLFSTPVSENLDDYEYYYLYDDYSDIKLVMWLEY